MKHNNMIPNVHLRKHWRGFVRTWFNQPANKRRRQLRRQSARLTAGKRPVQLLRPVARGQTIRYNRLEKEGRGFSLLELKEAGLNAKFAKTIGIAVDHRRRNKCQESLQVNVKRLQTYLQNLVLYPRVAGKPKKGVVKDADNEAVKQAVAQNTHPTVLPLPKPIRRVKATIISQEMRKASVYRKIRALWYNAKFVGVKQKRKEAADAKKNM